VKPARRGPLPIAMDPLDASGGFGALSGALSVGLPYFSGLTMALAALVVGIALLRGAQRGRAGGVRPATIPPFLVALVVALAGWVAFFAAPPWLASIRGLALGVSVLPLWWLERRPPAFGEA